MNSCLLIILFVVAAIAPPAIAQSSEEDRLIAVLQSTATVVEKEDACRRLKLIGTAKSVSALAGLLREDDLFQAACDALETMPFKEVDAALLSALKAASGKRKAGIIHVLGERRTIEAGKPLAALLTEADPMVASAAARALGSIGGKEASRALLKARKSAPVPVQVAVVDALLQCATRLLAEDERDAAVSLFRQLAAPTEMEHVRVAACVGLLRTAGARALIETVSAIKSSDAAKQTAALLVARELRDAGATAAFTNLLSEVSPATQIAVLGVLQQREDVTATPAVVGLARSYDATVRLASLATLGTIGDATAIPVLAEAATARDEAERKLARSALVELRHPGIAAALVAHLANASPAVQSELISALTARNEKLAVPELLESARSETAAPRRAALRGLEQLAESADLPALVQLLIAADDDAARGEVRRVFESLADRALAGQPLDVTPIAAAFPKADAQSRCALLSVCGLFPDPRISATVRTALQYPDPAIQDAARRALSETRDVELLPDLLNLARRSPEWSAAAFNQYVRLVSDEANGLAGERRAQLLQPAYELAKNKEQKWVVLAALADASHLEALNLANRARADHATRAEAEIACTRIAKSLLSSEPTAATTTLRQLAADGSSLGVRTNAQAILKQFDSGWVYAGPYRQAGKQCSELFDIKFPPELSRTNRIEWGRAAGTADLTRPGEVALADVVGGDHCVVYLKTRVFAPKRGPVTLEIGSDDGIKLWVNGELVHTNNAVRGLAPAQDLAKANLREGWNNLLAKVTQSTAGSGMMLRILGADGAEISGEKFDPNGGL